MPVAYNAQTGEALRLDEGGQWVKTQLARNPQTGEQLAFDGAEWKPVASPAAKTQAMAAPAQNREQAKIAETLAADGYTPEQIEDYQRGYGEGFSQSALGGLAGKVAQGLSFGYGDEIKGALRAPFTGNSRLYETARARGQLDRAKDDAPGTSLGLEVAGAVAPSVLGGIGLARALGPAANFATNMARGGVAGAIEGGVYGAGNEVGGLEERLAGAVPGALIGGAVGAVATPAVELGLSALRRGRAALTEAGGTAQARRAFQTILEESGATPTTVATRMRQAQAGGTPLTMGEAVGQQGVDLMEAAAQAPGPGREALTAQLGERQLLQSGRLVDALRRTSGVNAGAVDTMKATVKARAKAARPNYAALGGIPAPDDVMRSMWSFLKSSAGKSAYQRAADIAEQEAIAAGGAARKFPSYKELMDGARLTVGEADTILQGLESAAQGKMTPAFVPGGLKDTGDSIAYNKTARMLRGMLEKKVPEFAKARSEWAGPSQFVDAIKQGDKVAKMDLDTFKSYWRGLNPAQQEGVKIGFINDLKSEMEQFVAGPTANAARIWHGKGALRQKLRIAMGRDANELLDIVDVEDLTSRNTNQITGNSATARREAAAEAMGDDAATWQAFTPSAIIGRITGKLDQFARRNTRNAVARLGLTTDPDRAEALVDAILRGPPVRPRGAVSGAVVGGPAGAAGAAITDQN